MNTNLAQLIQLSELDANIDAFSPQIAAAMGPAQALEQQIASLEKQAAALSEHVKEQRDARARTDNLIAELGAKLESIKEKSQQVTKEKEIQALTVEEDITNEQLNKAHGDIERFEKACASASEELAATQSKIAELSEQLEQANAEQQKELKQIETARAKVYAQKEELAKSVEQKLLAFYEKIRKWAKNTAVVKVKNQACYGCFMKLNYKAYAAVRQSDEINTCPHCGRIIYYLPEDAPAPAQEPAEKKPAKRASKSKKGE